MIRAPHSHANGDLPELITEAALIDANWTQHDLAQLPTPHGGREPYWPIEDILPWLATEGTR
jgi:hypothetical protein